jgi:hypothetical protein
MDAGDATQDEATGNLLDRSKSREEGGAVTRLTEDERRRRLSVLVNAVLAAESDRESIAEPAGPDARPPISYEPKPSSTDSGRSRRDHITFWNMFSILSRLGYPTGDDA